MITAPRSAQNSVCGAPWRSSAGTHNFCNQSSPPKNEPSPLENSHIPTKLYPIYMKNPHAQHSSTALDVARTAILDDPFSSTEELAKRLGVSETTVKEARRSLKTSVSAELARTLSTNHLHAIQSHIVAARARQSDLATHLKTLEQDLEENNTYYPSIQDTAPMTQRDRLGTISQILAIHREIQAIDTTIVSSYMDKQTSLLLDAFQSRTIDLESEASKSRQDEPSTTESEKSAATDTPALPPAAAAAGEDEDDLFR